MCLDEFAKVGYPFFMSSSSSSKSCLAKSARHKEPLQQLAEIARLPKRSKAYSKAVERFLFEHVALAYAYAEKWRTAQIPQEDLRQQAILGLLEAIHLWKPEKASFFSTYAIHRMRYQISRFVEKKWPLVHVPQNVLADRRQVKKAERTLEKELGRPPTHQEIQARVSFLSSIRLELALAYKQGLHFQPIEENQF